ncbi:Delta(24)-sterol C-methyltransferase [Cryomyces antarcticus]|uniref:Delta(24)-sterol C-methyltransferase n=1 Tax=Cryomyces antarcticus TaxID=329879 RepID=A0ABR0KQM7_9PEZI|nr:Delta(24)-sterol C-methyltransferase [Cryomyces antarcticus]
MVLATLGRFEIHQHPWGYSYNPAHDQDRFVGALEMISLAPKGTQKTADSLALAGDCLVAGGKQKLFTPMYLMVGRKPKA